MDRRTREKLALQSDPARIAIVGQLAYAQATAAEIARTTGLPVARVRYLLQRLRRRDLVEVSGTTRRAGASENLYSFDPAKATVSAEELAAISPLGLDQMHAALLRSMLRESIEAAPAWEEECRWALGRMPLPLDSRGREEAMALHGAAVRETLELGRRSSRRSGGEPPPIEAVVCLLFFRLAPASTTGDTESAGDLVPRVARWRAASRRGLLADPLAWVALDRLAMRPASAIELAERIGVSADRVRHQLRRLKDDGRIAVIESRRRRGTLENVYSTDLRTAYEQEAGLAGSSPAARRALWQATTSIVFRDYLAAIRSEALRDPRELVVVRIPIGLDEEGWVESREVLARLAERLLVVREESIARLDETGESPVEFTSAWLGFDRSEAKQFH